MSIIFVNKPKGITSFDVCYKLRKVLNTKHIGHSGTLDPNASGVMVIASDKDTKALQFLKKDTKEYIATCTIGIKTDTLDIEGNVIEKLDNPYIPSIDEIKSVFNKFIGKSKQKPPMYSAIHVDGKRLYDLARKNIEVDIKEREIEIFEIELLSLKDNVFSFRCLVSSGTYIRVLLEDILKDLNTIGVLSDLVRTKSGNVTIDECFSLDSIEKGNYKEHTSFDILKDMYYVYNKANIKDVLDGKPIKDSSLNDDYILISDNNKAIAIYKKDKDKYTCVRGLF